MGSLGKAKASNVPLTKKSNEGATLDDPMVDTKAVIEAMLEVMAMAQVAKFPNIPIVNIFGGKMVFRPFIYFKQLDVMLTTPNVVPIRPNAESLNMLGLLVLLSIF